MMLGDYLRDAGRVPFGWGSHDCCTFAADWAVLSGAEDPMQRWRGAYETEAEALALIDAAGGLEALWQAACLMLPEPDEPRAGDIGLVQSITPDATGLVGGIFTGTRWAVLSERGLIVFPARPVRVWRV